MPCRACARNWVDQFKQSSSASKSVFKQKVKQDFHLFCTWAILSCFCEKLAICILHMHIAGTEVKQVCNINGKSVFFVFLYFCVFVCVLCGRQCFVFAKKLAIYILLGQTLIKGFKKI